MARFEGVAPLGLCISLTCGTPIVWGFTSHATMLSSKVLSMELCSLGDISPRSLRYFDAWTLQRCGLRNFSLESVHLCKTYNPMLLGPRVRFL